MLNPFNCNLAQCYSLTKKKFYLTLLTPFHTIFNPLAKKVKPILLSVLGDFYKSPTLSYEGKFLLPMKTLHTYPLGKLGSRTPYFSNLTE